MEDYWNNTLENHEMQFTVWGSQRLVYGAVYYAFEDFLTQCAGLRSWQTGKPGAKLGRNNKANRAGIRR